MKSYGLLLGACLLVGTNCAGAQATTTGNITTAGSCSPVVVQPKGAFQIICKDPNLTRAEALRQAQQISGLLTTLRANSRDNEELIKQLATVIKYLEDFKTMTASRHLSQVQRDAITAAIAPYPGSLIRLQINLGDSEAAIYASEFAAILGAQGLCGTSQKCGYDAAVWMPPVSGFVLQLNPNDLQGKAPSQCLALGKALKETVLNGQRIKAQPSNDIAIGTCMLVIGTKPAPLTAMPE
jgi:hypothetical protein